MILTDSLERADGLKNPEGKFYLVDVGYACRPGFLPPFRSIRYHLNEFSTRFYLRNTKELFNLRHSSFRVTVERAFATLKNRFKILDQKPFHTFPTQIKLVFACCILYKWIFGWGVDLFFPEEHEVMPYDNDVGHGVAGRWKNKRHEWADAVLARDGARGASQGHGPTNNVNFVKTAL
jgi:hypothetical protein